MQQKLRTTLIPYLSALALFGFSACADDLREEESAADAGNVEPGSPDAGQEGNLHVTHTTNDDGTTTTVVDATSSENWIYLDLGTQEEKAPMMPASSQGWDLGFRRFDLTLNGGASGPGGVTVLALPDQDFDALAVAPVGSYHTDLEDGDDDDSDPDRYFASEEGTWYDYNPKTHVLSPKERVYVVSSTEGDYYKFRFLDYYDAAGTGGILSFQWGPIEAPASIQSLTVDASAQDAWVYLALDTGEIVTVVTPESDPSWDLAVRRTSFRTNSGTSGNGAGGAVEVAEASLSSVTAAPADGYVVDSLLPIPGPPGSGEESGNASLGTWYDYDPVTHIVSPRATSFVIRTSDGDYSRLQITSYDGGMFGIDWSFAGTDTKEF